MLKLVRPSWRISNVKHSMTESLYQFESVWQRADTTKRESVVLFLLNEAGLSETEAAKRSHQVVVVARDKNHDTAAICTAFPVHVESLGFRCFYYRSLVGKSHRSVGLRTHQLAKNLLLESYHFLNARFAAGHDPDVLGLYLEVENPKLKRIRNEAIWESDGVRAVFVGKTHLSEKHCRVCYFEGARIF